MQICSPEDCSTGTITASPSIILVGQFKKKGGFATDGFCYRQMLHPSQEGFLNHDPLKAGGSWVIKVLKDCIQNRSLVHKEDWKHGAFDA